MLALAAAVVAAELVVRFAKAEVPTRALARAGSSERRNSTCNPERPPIYSDPAQAARSQRWMLVVMVCFTCLGLFLLSQSNQ